ncbi:unnamed protein product [Paramecium sonneborni]|uniref:Transmembrane protein n=1 Tax=Paramecium sonneborni TaxID=65129 RepID=A0A8S1RC97_9CILI|nr:unnamed protein product [Paramecium sonneborni]
MQQLYFIENESYSLDQSTLHIPFYDELDLYRKLENLSFVKLIEKQQELHLGLQDNTTLLTLLRDQGKYIDICALQNQIIDCKIRINNTLYNDDIIINELSYDPIHLPSKSCHNVFVIEDDSFLIHCQSSINIFQYFILNNKSLILDEILLDLPHNCKFDSKFQFNYIFIHSINCEISTILFIEIISKNQKPYFNHNYTKLHELNNYPKLHNLIDLKICDSTQILLLFDILMYIFYIDDQQFISYNYQYKSWFIYSETSCFPYIVKGSIQISINTNYYSLNVDNMINKESQLKKILNFNNIFIFLYEDYTEIIYGNLFKQSIFNVKQINPLNTLPFLVTLDQNNNISLYKVICLTKVIKYENYPYVGIFQKSLFGYSANQALLYYQTSFYSINQPIIIPSIQDINITQDQIHKNSFIIDTNSLFQSIPFYLNLQFDFNNILKESKNEMRITYEKLLRIKKILKVFSFEVNFIVIIYQDWNSKIFFYIQNGDFQKNVYVMKTNSKISVESFRENFDNILLLFIGSYQITKYEIQNKQDLVQIQKIMTKNKIKEYKMEDNKLICHMSDNNIIQYQSQIWYDYFQTQKKEIREFWLKNKKEKYDDFRVPYLYINYKENLLEIKPLVSSFNNIILSVNGQILQSHIFVPNMKILLIVQNEDEIQLKIYFFGINQISFLYQMPLYEFQIQYPIKIRQFENLFGIITTKNEQDYLFIYDVTQQGRSCLRQITKMQPDYNDFDLIDETGIQIQILSNAIFITYPIIQISIKQSRKSDYAQILSVLQFQTQSFIESIPTTFKINLYLQNLDNNLRFKFGVEKQMLFVNSQNEITNIDSIYGSINNIYLSNSCEGTIQKPIHIIQTKKQYCWIFKQQLCLLNNKQLIYDYFAQNRYFELQEHQIFLNYFLSSQQRILIIYDKQNNSIGIFNISKNDLIEQNFNDSIFYKEFGMNHIDSNIYQISQVNNLLVIYAQQFIMLYSLIENKLQYTGQCQIQGETKIQVEFLLIYDSSQIFLILETNYYLNLIICRKIMREIIQINFNPFFQIVAFHVLHSEIQDQEIYFRIILFSNQDIGYIYELKFETISFKLQKQKMSQILRYFNIIFENFQKLTDTIFILKGKSDQSISQSSSYLYKINRNSSNEIELVDYFYKYIQAYEIQYYNETHFIQIEQPTEQPIISLISINYYKVFAQNRCSIVLQNDVSKFDSIIIKEENILIKTQTTLYLVIINFLLIIFFNKKNKKQSFLHLQRL